MYDKVVFYCHYGSGDVHESREFIKEYMERIPASEYLYAHGKDPNLLQDIPNLGHTQVTEDMNMRSPFAEKDNILYINTWIGRDPQYVLPQVGCVLEEFYRMHNDMAKAMGLGSLTKDVYDYIPKINFENVYPSHLVDFIKTGKPVDKKYVLICNGQCHSNQGYNFDFTPSIIRLCQNYKDVEFAVVQNIGIELPNLKDFTKLSLMDIAFMSCGADVIVGRKSGPSTIAGHLDNWLDSTKTSLSFTYAKHSAHFVLSDHMPMKKVWSPATDPDEVYKEIERVL